MQRNYPRPSVNCKSINQLSRMKDENLENTVITLHVQKGWSIRRISRELQLSLKRIHRLLESNSVLRDTTPKDEIPLKKKHPSKLDAYKEFITGLILQGAAKKSHCTVKMME